MKKAFLLLCMFLFAWFSYAQEHAWVYFTDKSNVAVALANPNTILSQKAINRKLAHNIPIDIRDVPVNEAYITTIKNQPSIVVKAKSKWFNCVHVIGEQTDIAALENLGFVASIQYADNLLNSRSTGNAHVNSVYDKFDTQINFTYGNTQDQVQLVGTDVLHGNDYTGEGIVIAVLDAGFPNVNTLAGFQRLRDNNDLLGGYDFVLRSDDFNNPSLHYHGTYVLSDMAGFIQDEFVGTAPDAGYYLFRTEDATSETPVEESYWVEAAERADSLGVDMINSSLGYSTFDESKYNHSMLDMDGNTAFITKGANIAVEKGILVVTAAGNNGADPDFYIISAPADGNAFTIGAVTDAGNYATFSSIGPSADGRVKPDVMGMGQNAAAINQFDNITYANGTSLASPVICGSIASLWQADTTKSNLEIMQLVRESASLYSAPTSQMGYGIPNFATALAELLSNVTFNEESEIEVYPNPVVNTLRIKYGGADYYNITIYNTVGNIVFSKEHSSDYQIDFSNYASGVYLAEIKVGSIQTVFKLIKV